MKILILCKKFPYPLREGEPIAISYLSRSLKERGCSVSLLVLNTSKHYFDPSKLPASENHYDEIHSVNVDNRITLWGVTKSFILGEPYIINRFFSNTFKQKLQEVLVKRDYDIVQLETIYMAHYIPTIKNNSNAIIALRTHNVEHKIWEMVAANSHFLKKWYLNHQNGFLKKFELENINQCDILVAITEDDLNNFKKLGLYKKGIAIPVGFDVEKYETDFTPGPERQSIAFIGALDWMPNQYGIIWFIDNVWPKISGQFPDMELHIAGKNTPDWISKRSNDRIKIHGEVPDAKEFIKQHPVMIVPLFSGSGIKVKVLEGLALGRAMISTTVGMEGISALNEVHLFIADSAENFYDTVCKCFSTNIDLLKIRQSGKQFLHKEFDSKYLAAKMINACQALINENQNHS